MSVQEPIVAAMPAPLAEKPARQAPASEAAARSVAEGELMGTAIFAFAHAADQPLGRAAVLASKGALLALVTVGPVVAFGAMLLN